MCEGTNNIPVESTNTKPIVDRRHMEISNGMIIVSDDRWSIKQRQLIQKTSKYVLNTFIYLMILGFLNLPMKIFALAVNGSPWTVEHYRETLIVSIHLIMIILYGFGMIVLDQRSRTGIILFAWLATIFDALATLATVFFIYWLIRLKNEHYQLYQDSLIVTILFLCMWIGSIFIITFSIQKAFVLSNMLKKRRTTTPMI